MRPAFLFSLACVAICSIALCAVPCYGGGKSQETKQAQAGETFNQQTSQRIGVRGGLVFVGVSGRLSSREASIQTALEDAARRLSFFYSVGGHSSRIEHIGSREMDFRIEREYQLEYDTELEPFLQQLEYDPATDVFEINNAVFVVARATSGVSMPPFQGHSFGRERPAWIDTPPAQIGGFAVGIGVASRHSSHRDTVVKSYESAVLGIIESMNSNVAGGQESYVNNYSAFGFGLTTSNVTTAQGMLRNFYIIETWSDPATLEVWTLAVASKAGP